MGMKSMGCGQTDKEQKRELRCHASARHSALLCLQVGGTEGRQRRRRRKGEGLEKGVSPAQQAEASCLPGMGTGLDNLASFMCLSLCLPACLPTCGPLHMLVRRRDRPQPMTLICATMLGVPNMYVPPMYVRWDSFSLP